MTPQTIEMLNIDHVQWYLPYPELFLGESQTCLATLVGIFTGTLEQLCFGTCWHDSLGTCWQFSLGTCWHDSLGTWTGTCWQFSLGTWRHKSWLSTPREACWFVPVDTFQMVSWLGHWCSSVEEPSYTSYHNHHILYDLHHLLCRPPCMMWSTSSHKMSRTRCCTVARSWCCTWSHSWSRSWC